MSNDQEPKPLNANGDSDVNAEVNVDQESAAPVDNKQQSESNLSAVQLKNIVEALVMASDKPLSLEKLHALFELHEQPTKNQLKDAIAQLQMDYAGRGVQLVSVASGYRFQSVAEVSRYVARLWEERPQRYSRALLETLSLIAYRQPITRGEIEEVRGVAVSSHIVKTLLERQWIKVVGHREVPGRPAIYATTRHFLDYFNLASLEQLPPLSEMRDIDAIAREVSEQLELGGFEGEEGESDSDHESSDDDLNKASSSEEANDHQDQIENETLGEPPETHH